MRQRDVVGCIWLLLGLGASGQVVVPAAGAAKLPVYEVVSIKPNKGESGGMSWQSTPSGVRMVNVTLMTLVRASDFALRHATNDRIIGLPAWADKEHFDIEAKVGEEDVTAFKKTNEEQRCLIMWRLLEDRFKFKAHVETREMPIYELVVAKGGAKMTPTKEADVKDENFGGMSIGSSGSVTKAEYKGFEVSALADNLTQNLNHPVVDKTGLTGRYDFKLEWTPEDAPEMPGSTVPGIFTAVQEQLGLRLDARKGPVEGLVVDHVEEPSAN